MGAILGLVNDDEERTSRAPSARGLPLGQLVGMKIVVHQSKKWRPFRS